MQDERLTARPRLQRMINMTEKAYEISMISGTQCPDGRHFQELVCIDEEKKVIRILLPVTNNCEDMPFGESRRCKDCEYYDTCEIQAPCEVVLGRKLVIVDRGEVAQEKN